MGELLHPARHFMAGAVVDVGRVEIMRAPGRVGVVTAGGDGDCRGTVGVVEHVLLGDAEGGGRGEASPEPRFRA